MLLVLAWDVHAVRFVAVSEGVGAGADGFQSPGGGAVGKLTEIYVSLRGLVPERRKICQKLLIRFCACHILAGTSQERVAFLTEF